MEPSLRDWENLTRWTSGGLLMLLQWSPVLGTGKTWGSCMVPQCRLVLQWSPVLGTGKTPEPTTWTRVKTWWLQWSPVLGTGKTDETLPHRKQDFWLQWSPVLGTGKNVSIVRRCLSGMSAAMEPSLRDWENLLLWGRYWAALEVLQWSPVLGTGKTRGNFDS